MARYNRYFRWLLSCTVTVLIDAGVEVRGDDWTPLLDVSIVTSEDEFFWSLQERVQGMSEQEWRDECTEWRDRLKPMVEPEELALLIESQRESISAIHTIVQVQERVNDGDTKPWIIRSEFARRNDALFNSLEIVERGDLDIGQGLYSTDGELEEVIRGGSGSQQTGEIRYLADRKHYFDPWDPLALQMLVDSPRDFGALWVPYDLTSFLRRQSCSVLEDVVEIDGSRCIVAVLGIPAGLRVFLDIDRDFAVVQYEEIFYERDGKVPVGRWKGRVRRAKDFQAYPNGLWLPSSVIVELYDRGGSVTRRREHHLLEATIGAAVNEQLFSGIFSEGMFVSDQIRQVGYHYGVDDTVEDALGREVETITGNEASKMRGKEAGLADWGGSTWKVYPDSALSGVCVIIIIAFWWARRQAGVSTRRRKNEGTDDTATTT